MSLGPNDFIQLIKQLEGLRDHFLNDREIVSSIYSSISPEHDARITMYSKVINVINSVQLAFTFISKYLLHHEWWANISENPIPDSDKYIYVNEFANFTKIGFVQGLFMAVESSLRLFLRAIDLTACKGGMAEFKSIYVCLFKSKLSVEPANGIALLDLLRLVRNSIHHNGVYFHPSGDDASITWDDETFDFNQGKPVDFVTWDFMLRFSEALHNLLREIVEDTNLKAISVEIDDPFSR